MLIQFVGLFFGNKMLGTSLGQVVGKNITTTLYSSVVDSVLQIRRGGGGHKGPEMRMRGGGQSQNFWGVFQASVWPKNKRLDLPL